MWNPSTPHKSIFNYHIYFLHDEDIKKSWNQSSILKRLVFADWNPSKVCSFLLPVFSKMLVAQKWKLVNKSVKEKCAAWKELHKGPSNKDVASKHRMLKNTLSKWVKKNNFWQLTKKGNKTKQQKPVKQTTILSTKSYLNDSSLFKVKIFL